MVGVLVLGDALLRRTSGSPVPGVVVVIAVTGATWSLFVRPCVIADQAGVRLCNVARDVSVPWGRLASVDAPLTFTVHDDDDHAWRSWAISASNRPRRNAAALRPMFGTAQTGPVTARELRADAVVRQVTELREAMDARGTGDGVVRVSVAWAGLLPLLVSAIPVLVWAAR